MKKFKEFVNEGNDYYTYDVVRVLVEDNDFSKRVQELCFNHGFKWFNGDNEFFVVSIRSYCIDIDLKNKLLFLDPSGKGTINLAYWNSVESTVDPKIYTKIDFELVNNIFNYGFNRPSYKPRKHL